MFALLLRDDVHSLIINYFGFHFHPFAMTFLGFIHPSICPVNLDPDGENNQSERERRRPTFEEVSSETAASGAAFELPFLFALEIRRPLTSPSWRVSSVPISLPPTLGSADRVQGRVFAQSSNDSTASHFIRIKYLCSRLCPFPV